MHLRTLLIFLLLLVLLRKSKQASTPADPTYYAGVVEFSASQLSDPKDRVKDNLRLFKNIIESTDTVNLDILVFPENVLNSYGWTTYVPNPAEKIAPCDIPDYDNFLSELSCAARSRQLYLVINVVEKEYCQLPGFKGSCDVTGLNKYNTNVVFDRQGRVISRYRKTHLYRYEWNRMVAAKPQIATFETDFGVKFGHFICFDILFYEPAQQLIKEHNISDIIFPHYWFSELPFLTALQTQESYAFANDVNLLAASGNMPTTQNSGSGIYAGQLGRLEAVIFEDATTRLIKAAVPKRDRRAEASLPPAFVPNFVPQLQMNRFTKMNPLRDYNLDVFTTKLLAEDFTNIAEELCHGKFCCSFNTQRSLISSSTTHTAYRYRLVAYDGPETTFQRIDRSEIAVCALVACTNAELYSCGHIFPANVLVGNKYYFNSISINGTFRNAPRRSIHPSSVDGMMMPVPVSMTNWEEVRSATHTEVNYKLTSPKSDLLTFGIWTNYYSTAVATHNLDPIAFRDNAGITVTLKKFNIVLVFLALLKSYL